MGAGHGLTIRDFEVYDMSRSHLSPNNPSIVQAGEGTEITDDGHDDMPAITLAMVHDEMLYGYKSGQGIGGNKNINVVRWATEQKKNPQWWKGRPSLDALIRPAPGKPKQRTKKERSQGPLRSHGL